MPGQLRRPTKPFSFVTQGQAGGAPIPEMHHGIVVGRDDLFPGGTKAHLLARAFESVQEAVYASPPEGVARRLSKRS